MAQEYELIEKSYDQLQIGDIVRYDSFKVYDEAEREKHRHLFEPNDGKFFKLVDLVSNKSYDYGGESYEHGYYLGQCIDNSNTIAKFSIADYGGTKMLMEGQLVPCMTLLTYKVRVPKA